MPEPTYTLYADRPFYKKLPWWVWALGAVVLVWATAKRRARAAEFEDYLR